MTDENWPKSITKADEPYPAEALNQILNPTIRAWFASRFKDFSLPQRFGVIPIHQRENILVSAPTGATKTLTGFLAILNELVDNAEKGILEDKIYCVYISPLKALNNDIRKNLVEPLAEIEKIAGKSLGIRVGVRTGDTTDKEKADMLKHPPHILITTPESLAIVLASTKFIDHLRAVEWVIVDEIHALAENKRGVHLSISLERLEELCGHVCRVGLSATVAPIQEVAHFLVGTDRPCKVIDVQFLKQLDVQVISPVDNLIDTPHALLHGKMYELVDRLVQEHRTTLIFTNTRAATERVVDHLKNRWPSRYEGNIGAHHGSLAKEQRHDIERRLRDGELKVCVSSTSLELGIDIGYIDLVICLGSPKSVARFLQRAGRAGHRLHQTVKARIIVMDRDDLIECACLVKAAREKRIDRLHIPTNCLDVLAQQTVGAAMAKEWDEKELYDLMRKSFCYKDLKREEFSEILEYLSGSFVELQDRHIYARIWRENGRLGKRGKLSRPIYMSNIGTIPDESFVTVKVGAQPIGTIDEGFLERLKPGDVFVLGGNTYVFKFSRGTVAQVAASSNRPPTVPHWVSEMLPLSFDLAVDIGKFRRLMLERLTNRLPEAEMLKFIHEYLSVDENAARAIHAYFREQYDFCGRIPNDKMILLEHYDDEKDTKMVFHALFGRRVNDCLSRAIAFAISRTHHKDVEIGINDNGFYLVAPKRLPAADALRLLKSDKLERIMRVAIEKSEVFKRRFRHCASRALMILRNFMGHTKNVGSQQVSAQILCLALKRINPDFSVLKEARRECLEDLMDIRNAERVLKGLESGAIQLVEMESTVPSPFAFNLALQGYMDVLRVEDRHEFLRRMHEMVIAKLKLPKERRVTDRGSPDGDERRIFDYKAFWEKQADEGRRKDEEQRIFLRTQLAELHGVDGYVKDEVGKLIDGDRIDIRTDVIAQLVADRQLVFKTWPPELAAFILRAADDVLV